MTFIPDPNTLSVGDALYLTKEYHIENYGTFTVGHEFHLSSAAAVWQYYWASDATSIQVEALDRLGPFFIPKSDLSRVRP